MRLPVGLAKEMETRPVLRRCECFAAAGVCDCWLQSGCRVLRVSWGFGVSARGGVAVLFYMDGKGLRGASPTAGCCHCTNYMSRVCRHSSVSKIPEELLKPSYLLLEPVRYTLAEILRLCRRPMVLPGPLVRSFLQDLLGAVALCHDRNVVIKSLDAEKVGRTIFVSKKLPCCSVLLACLYL